MITVAVCFFSAGTTYGARADMLASLQQQLKQVFPIKRKSMDGGYQQVQKRNEEESPQKASESDSKANQAKAMAMMDGLMGRRR